MKLLDGKWSIDAYESTVLKDPDAFYVIRSVAEAIMMVTDEIYILYPP